MDYVVTLIPATTTYQLDKRIQEERLEDEQKELEGKAVRRIQRSSAKGAWNEFRILLVQALLEAGSVVAQQGLDSAGLEAQCGESTTPLRPEQSPWIWMDLDDYHVHHHAGTPRKIGPQAGTKSPK